MHHFWKKVEHVNHHLIFPAIILLLFIIVFELFIHTENHTLELAVHIADYIVIAIFVVDLIFLGIRAKSTKFFFQNYWLDLIAVFPFALTFGVIGEFSRIFRASEEVVGVGQAIFHEGVEVTKATARVERFAKVGRGVKIGARVLRVVSKTRLFTRFHRRKLKHVRV